MCGLLCTAFHLAQCFQGLAMVQHVGVCHSFSQLNQISLYGETSFCLFTHLLMGIGLSHLHTPLFLFHCLPPQSSLSQLVVLTLTQLFRLQIQQSSWIPLFLLAPPYPLTSKPPASLAISYRYVPTCPYFTPSAATTQSKLLFLWAQLKVFLLPFFPLQFIPLQQSKLIFHKSESYHETIMLKTFQRHPITLGIKSKCLAMAKKASTTQPHLPL